MVNGRAVGEVAFVGSVGSGGGGAGRGEVLFGARVVQLPTEPADDGWPKLWARWRLAGTGIGNEPDGVCAECLGDRLSVVSEVSFVADANDANDVLVDESDRWRECVAEDEILLERVLSS